MINQRVRTTLAVLCMALLISQSGCMLWKVRNASPELKYFAAVSEYVVVKEAATMYAELPSASVGSIEQIFKVVVKGDKIVSDIDSLRKGEEVKSSEYVRATAAVLNVVTLLKNLIKPGGN